MGYLKHVKNSFIRTSGIGGVKHRYLEMEAAYSGVNLPWIS